MKSLNEEVFRIKEMMGLDEGPNSSAYKGPEGYDDSCDCYPEDEEVIESEIDEQEEGGGGESAPSSPSMGKWETGVSRGKANPIDTSAKWETGITRGKGNPVW
jgi:hypothetical protein